MFLLIGARWDHLEWTSSLAPFFLYLKPYYIPLTVPLSPSTSIISPSLNLEVARPTPSTAGILNSLAGYENLVDKEKIEKILEKANIDTKRRGETLSIYEFAILTKAYKDYLQNS